MNLLHEQELTNNSDYSNNENIITISLPLGSFEFSTRIEDLSETQFKTSFIKDYSRHNGDGHILLNSSVRNNIYNDIMSNIGYKVRHIIETLLPDND